MVIGIQPVILEPAELFEGSVFNHGDILSRSCCSEYDASGRSL